MPWVRLDDQFYNHPKLGLLGMYMLPCVGLHVLSLCYCNAYLTDGFIPEGQVARLAGELRLLMPEDEAWKELAQRLIDAGLWEQHDVGYVIHDFLEYNPSRKETLKLRKMRASIGQQGGYQKASNLLAKRKQKSTPYPSPYPVSDQKEQEPPHTPPGGFDAFWSLYPRKVGKGAAFKAWARIAPTNGQCEAMCAAVRSQMRWDQWTKNNGQFVPHPATWLNQRRWEDEGDGQRPRPDGPGAAIPPVGRRLRD